MKKTIIALLIGGVLIVGAVLLSPSNSGSEKSTVTPRAITAEIIVDRYDHDFGQIDIFGGKVETDFVLTNTGTQDITVEQATTSCGCTEGSISGVNFGMHQGMSQSVVIPAGKSSSLTAIYDPLAHGPDATGEITRQLFLKTDSTKTPEIEVRISADVFKN